MRNRDNIFKKQEMEKSDVLSKNCIKHDHLAHVYVCIFKHVRVCKLNIC